MDKIYTSERYIRLTTERMVWSNQVAKCVGMHKAAENIPKMYAFKGVQNIIRYVPVSEAVFITAKEYFAEKLKGHEFDEHD